MDIQKLTNLKTEIENIDKIHHIKILQILINNDVKYSENRNGIFVNMNSFNDKTIGEIQTMLLYIKEQEKNLNDIENINFIKKELKLKKIQSIKIKKGDYEIEISSSENVNYQRIQQISSQDENSQKILLRSNFCISLNKLSIFCSSL